MRALIGISISREWNESEFTRQMGTWKIPKGWELKFGWLTLFTASERHNSAVAESVNYDRLLFMDTDQIYPYDYLEKMLAHKEPVVSALTVSRYYPFEFTTYKLGREENFNGFKYPVVEAIQPPSDKKVFECDMTGTAALMIDSEVLAKLPRPVFKDIYDDDGKRLCPDDFYFSWQLLKAGYKPIVDQNIVVSHLAKIIASPYNVRDLRRAWIAVNSGQGLWKDGRPA